MKEKIIAEVYKRMINIVLLDVPEDLKEEFTSSYYKYLLDTNLDNLDNSDISNIIQYETSKWKFSSLNLKLSTILEDKAYDEIKKISSNGYKLAQERLENPSNIPVDINTADNNMESLRQNLLKVRDFNQEVAQQIVSEGIMDYSYASGQTENMSFRIGRQVRR